MNHFLCSPSYICTYLATVLLHPGFAKWLSSCLHLFILYLPLWKAKSRKVQPIINDAIEIFCLVELLEFYQWSNLITLFQIQF